jgi:threonine dehydratase
VAVTIDDIRAAADRLERKVVRTPTLRSDALSALCGANIVLKLENLQLTGSFKPRGVFIKPVFSILRPPLTSNPPTTRTINQETIKGLGNHHRARISKAASPSRSISTDAIDILQARAPWRH